MADSPAEPFVRANEIGQTIEGRLLKKASSHRRYQIRNFCLEDNVFFYTNKSKTTEYVFSGGTSDTLITGVRLASDDSFVVSVGKRDIELKVPADSSRTASEWTMQISARMQQAIAPSGSPVPLATAIEPPASATETGSSSSPRAEADGAGAEGAGEAVDSGIAGTDAKTVGEDTDANAAMKDAGPKLREPGSTVVGGDPPEKHRGPSANSGSPAQQQTERYVPLGAAPPTPHHGFDDDDRSSEHGGLCPSFGCWCGK